MVRTCMSVWPGRVTGELQLCRQQSPKNHPCTPRIARLKVSHKPAEGIKPFEEFGDWPDNGSPCISLNSSHHSKPADRIGRPSTF
jgi:hypothetical protein